MTPPEKAGLDEVTPMLKLLSARDSVLEFLYHRRGEFSHISLSDLTAPATWGCAAEHLDEFHLTEALLYLGEKNLLELETPGHGPADSPAPRSRITPRGQSLVESGRGICYINNRFTMELVLASMSHVMGPQVWIGVPELWTAEPGELGADHALMLTGPGGMSGWVRIGAVEQSSDKMLEQYLDAMRSEYPGGTFDVRPSFVGGMESYRILGREDLNSYADHLTFVDQIDVRSLVAVHMSGPSDTHHYDPLGFEASKSVLMQDFPIQIPEWRRPVLPQGD